MIATFIKIAIFNIIGTALMLSAIIYINKKWGKGK